MGEEKKISFPYQECNNDFLVNRPIIAHSLIIVPAVPSWLHCFLNICFKMVITVVLNTDRIQNCCI